MAYLKQTHKQINKTSNQTEIILSSPEQREDLTPLQPSQPVTVRAPPTDAVLELNHAGNFSNSSGAEQNN